MTPHAFDPLNIFKALARHEVRYVTVGGVALQAHGAQRLTQDLDIAIASNSENLERLATALAEIDARILGPEGQRSARSPTASLLGSSDHWQLITDHGAVDVIVPPPHLGGFEAMRTRALEAEVSGTTIPVASAADLLTMKRASGRPQDQADVQLLESMEADDSAG